jgi:hypothetical protein
MGLSFVSTGFLAGLQVAGAICVEAGKVIAEP